MNPEVTCWETGSDERNDFAYNMQNIQEETLWIAEAEPTFGIPFKSLMDLYAQQDYTEFMSFVIFLLLQQRYAWQSAFSHMLRFTDT